VNKFKRKSHPDDLVKISERMKLEIKEFLPNFDAERKDITASELNELVWKIRKKRKDYYLILKKQAIDKKGIKIGSMVIVCGEEYIVRGFSKDWSILLEDKKGSFNPTVIQTKEENT
jgi:hypothetical protein